MLFYAKNARIEGGEVAGYENIKDANSNRTPEERRELAKIAGEASGAARRRKADFGWPDPSDDNIQERYSAVAGLFSCVFVEYCQNLVYDLSECGVS